MRFDGFALMLDLRATVSLYRLAQAALSRHVLSVVVDEGRRTKDKEAHVGVDQGRSMLRPYNAVFPGCVGGWQGRHGRLPIR